MLLHVALGNMFKLVFLLFYVVFLVLWSFFAVEITSVPLSLYISLVPPTPLSIPCMILASSWSMFLERHVMTVLPDFGGGHHEANHHEANRWEPDRCHLM